MGVNKIKKIQLFLTHLVNGFCNIYIVYNCIVNKHLFSASVTMLCFKLHACSKLVDGGVTLWHLLQQVFIIL